MSLTWSYSMYTRISEVVSSVSDLVLQYSRISEVVSSVSDLVLQYTRISEVVSSVSDLVLRLYPLSFTWSCSCWRERKTAMLMDSASLISSSKYHS